MWSASCVSKQLLAEGQHQLRSPNRLPPGPRSLPRPGHSQQPDVASWQISRMHGLQIRSALWHLWSILAGARLQMSSAAHKMSTCCDAAMLERTAPKDCPISPCLAFPRPLCLRLCKCLLADTCRICRADNGHHFGPHCNVMLRRQEISILALQACQSAIEARC